MKTIRESVAFGYRIGRMLTRAESAGLKVTTKRELARMTNVQMRGGRLLDATCHYEWVTLIEGNTYPLRSEIKSIGAKWNGKCWTLKGTQTVRVLEVLCRKLAGK